jgi:signal transduction histidine kinase
MSADMTTPRLPERVLTAHPLRTLLATLILAGGVTAWVTSLVPADGRTWTASAGTVAAVLLGGAVMAAASTARTADRLRRRVAEAEARAGTSARLADEVLPAAVARLRDGASVDTVLAQLPSAADTGHHRIMAAAVREVGRSERMRAASMLACANAAGRVQALATTMLADLRGLEDRCDEELLGDLLQLDHSTAQAGRLADSIAVLTGARSGRRWTKPIVMESILRGAVGRISAYRRVRVHSTSTVAVVGYAAEGVIHVLAELIDNAANFSPPSEQVHVYVEEVQAGAVVTVEDSGLGMREQALRRAEETVAADPLDLTQLSGTRLGLAVVGMLARKHHLTVTFRPSSRGGTGVVVMIPRHLLTEARTQAGRDVPRRSAAGKARAKVPAQAAGHAAVLDDPAPRAGAAAEVPAGDRDPDLGGLPKRRRGQTLAAAGGPRRAPRAAAKPRRADSGARFGSFREAVRRAEKSITDGAGATGSGERPPADDGTE